MRFLAPLPPLLLWQAAAEKCSAATTSPLPPLPPLLREKGRTRRVPRWARPKHRAVSNRSSSSRTDPRSGGSGGAAKSLLTNEYSPAASRRFRRFRRFARRAVGASTSCASSMSQTRAAVTKTRSRATDRAGTLGSDRRARQAQARHLRKRNPRSSRSGARLDRRAPRRQALHHAGSAHTERSSATAS
jgi:hypothetical protein